MILMSRLRSARVTKVLEKAGEMSVYESAALPTELRRLVLILNGRKTRVKKPESLSDKDHVRSAFRGISDFRLEEVPRPEIRGRARDWSRTTARSISLRRPGTTRRRRGIFRSPLPTVRAKAPIVCIRPARSPKER